MKKLICFILLLSSIICMAVLAYASADYTFDLSADRQRVQVGDTFRVTLTVSRNDGQQIDLYAMQDYIVFDPEYFTVDESSYEILQSTDGVPYDLFGATAMSFGGAPTDRVYVNHASSSPVYLPSQIDVISFELTALKEGTSTLTHDTIEVVGDDMRVYSTVSNDLTITVGDGDDTQSTTEPTTETTTAATTTSDVTTQVTTTADGTTETTTEAATETTTTTRPGGNGGGGGGGGSTTNTTGSSTSGSSSSAANPGTSGNDTAEGTADDTPGSTGEQGGSWQNPFTDVNENDWFFDAVQYTNENGIFSGITSSSFEPNTPVTRAMMVAVLYRAEGSPTADTNSKFADVSPEAYYAQAVVWAEENNIVYGFSDTVFAPEQNITREQIAAIMERYADYKGQTTDEAGDLTQFTDNDSISWWAVENVRWAVGRGIISGKGNNILDPLGNATRAEIASIIMRFIEG